MGRSRPPCAERAIVALLSEPTLAAAAEQCQIHERTLRRWLTDRAFQEELDAARRGLMFETAIRPAPAAGGAGGRHAGVALMDPSAPPSVRLGAARTVDRARASTATTRRPFCAEAR